MINTNLVRIALNSVGGFQFEDFVNQFYAALVGASFIPLGGVKDGGADGTDEKIFEASGGRSFYQASIERSPEDKIRRTVQRLREFGRDPRTLTYVTSQHVKYLDQLEEKLTEELDVTIRVRDGAYIENHINYSPQTRAAFDTHLRHFTDYLASVGASKVIPISRHVRSPAVYVFLSQEVARRAGDESLLDAVADSLSLWALEGTDPDRDILRSSDEVLNRICEELPSVRPLLSGRIQDRLEHLSRKRPNGVRDVRWYQKDNLFCLPHETRLRIGQENLADEALRLSVLTGFEDRVRENFEASVRNDAEVELAAQVVLRSLQFAFEREGLEFVKFLEEKEGGEYPTIADSVKQAIEQFGLSGKKAVRIGAAVMSAARRVLYSSTLVERTYLAKLSRTYALLFMLNTDPHLIDFFQDMTGDLRLYVGTDVLVRALSEHCLAKEDQMTCNMLAMAAQLGADLVLTEPVLEEVVSNLRVSDWEYKNNYQAIDQHVNYDMARNVSKIMLRAYFYSRLDTTASVRRFTSWNAFVGQFCDYVDLHKSFAMSDMRRYLQVEYKMQFESGEELRRVVDGDALADLTRKLLDIKSGKFELAQNDALMALSVYGRRGQNREESTITEFGYKTWWLTSETAITRQTVNLVKSKNGARYIMPPDFLLNFIALAPSAHEVRKTFASVFPSLLGIALSKRMSDGSFKEIVGKVRDAGELTDARRTAQIAKLSDRLKGDLVKQYVSSWGSASSDSSMD